MDERITSHILNPMPTVSGIDAATGYKWLEDDLRFRADLTAQLNQERDLTNAQSMRQELDRKFVQDTENDAMAIDGMNAINSIMRANPDLGWKGATSQFFSENPGAIENDVLFENVKRLAAVYESEPERASARLAMEVNDEANRLKLMDARSQRRLYEEDPDLRYRVLKRSARNEELGLEASEPEILAKKVEAETSYRSALANKARIEAIGEEGDLEANAIIQDVVGATGINIEDGPSIVNALRESRKALLMLSDTDWSSSLSEEQKQELGNALNTFADTSKSPAETRAARASLARYISVHNRHIQDAKNSVEAREKLLKVGSDLGSSFGDLVKQMDSFRKEPIQKESSKDETVSTPGARALQTADAWIKQQIISNPLLKGSEAKALKDLKDAWSEASDEKRIEKAENIAEDFALEVSGALLNATTAREEVKPAAAPEANTGKKVATREIANQYLFRAGGDMNKAAAMMRADGYTP